MKKEPLVRKFFPVEEYDMAGLAKWFSELEGQGLQLVKLKFGRAYFRPCTPNTGPRYALDTATQYSIDQDRNEAYEQMGWRYVATLQDRYYVYRAEDSSAPTLHTDPVTQSIPMRKQIRRQWRNLIGLMVLYPIMFRDLLSLLIPSPLPFFKLIILKTIPGLLLFAAIIMCLVDVFLPLCRGQYSLIKLARQLENGIALDESQRRTRRIPASVSSWLSGGLIVTSLFLAVWLNSSQFTRVLTGPEEWTFPHVTLEQVLHQEDILSVESDPEKLLQNENTLHRSLLAPAQYEWNQNADVTLLTGNTVRYRIHLTYVQTRSPDLANWLLQGYVLEGQKRWQYSETALVPFKIVVAYDFIPVSHEGFDVLVMRQQELDGKQQRYYVGQVGSQVVLLTYDGPMDIDHYLDLLAEELNAEWTV